MNTNLEAVGVVGVIELLGSSLDASNAEDLMGRLTFLASEYRCLVVDLGQVRFVDSAGCGALVAGMHRFRDAGGDLRVCNLTPHVKTALSIARVQRVLPVYDTREQAVAAFNS